MSVGGVMEVIKLPDSKANFDRRMKVKWIEAQRELEKLIILLNKYKEGRCKK